MSSKSISLTTVVSLATAIGTVVLSFPAFAQVQNNSGVINPGQTNSGAVSAPPGSIITTTPDGTTIVTPSGTQGGTGAPNNTVNPGSGTTNTTTGTSGGTGGTPTTGVTNQTPPTGVNTGTPTTGVTIPSTGTAPASTTPVGGTTGQ